jgi:hypothetical protein
VLWKERGVALMCDTELSSRASVGFHGHRYEPLGDGAVALDRLVLGYSLLGDFHGCRSWSWNMMSDRASRLGLCHHWGRI